MYESISAPALSIKSGSPIVGSDNSVVLFILVASSSSCPGTPGGDTDSEHETQTQADRERTAKDHLQGSLEDPAQFLEDHNATQNYTNLEIDNAEYLDPDTNAIEGAHRPHPGRQAANAGAVFTSHGVHRDSMPLEHPTIEGVLKRDDVDGEIGALRRQGGDVVLHRGQAVGVVLVGGKSRHQKDNRRPQCGR